MPIHNRRHCWKFSKGVSALVLSAGLVTGLLVTTAVHAFDPDAVFKPDEEPRVILRYGYLALKNGNFEDAIGAFQLGAEKNDLASQWKLARMLQRGQGTVRDDFAAFKLFDKIANRYRDGMPVGQDRIYAANAITQIGKYWLTGIAGSPINADPRMAEDSFYRAAALMHDREAQYQLGMMYRLDTLGAPQPMLAARWLSLAARKGHPQAQAEVGEMLFYGEGVRRNPVRGLVFLARAAANRSRPEGDAMVTRHDQAMNDATPEIRDAAQKIITKMGLDTTPAAGSEIVKMLSGETALSVESPN